MTCQCGSELQALADALAQLDHEAGELRIDMIIHLVNEQRDYVQTLSDAEQTAWRALAVDQPPVFCLKTLAHLIDRSTFQVSWEEAIVAVLMRLRMAQSDYQRPENLVTLKKS